MAVSSTCLNCGAALTEGARGGFCPKCLFRLAGVGSMPKQPPDEEELGTVIGRYKLLEKVGEGGFGAVYVAEQREPVKRRVALKIIKLGMDTRQVTARFEAERQSLALMDHPNIARVFDGGATETGRPYFVMELVRGQRLTDYCDENNLSTEQRLDLFMQVCHAIQHAHQKGIIHRDIKPSNILVTVVDGQPVPKVIDFGVAKATHGQLTDQTVYTQLHHFIGTPAYMSPEQAQLSGVDVDTRSDIYSLGVLLYELLTGHTPFDARGLREAGLDEMRRIVREQEPPRPSARISTLDKAEQTTVAKRRQAEPASLTRLLRGDLDWIVMKCLEKERGRRYETASALAQDVQRHLGNRPIAARPPGKLYRLRKFGRRHRLSVAAGAAATLSLVIGLTVATVLFFREREQAAIATAVSEFLQNDLLRQADSRVQAATEFKANPNLTVREALERASQRIGERFKEQPMTELAIRLAVGDALRGIGHEARAVPHLLRALEISQTRLGPEHPETLRCMDKLGATYAEAGDLDRAVPLLEKTLKLRQARLGPDHPDTLATMNNLGSAYVHVAGKLEDAVRLLEQVVGRRKAVLGPDHPSTLDSMAWLGTANAYAGHLDRSVPLFEQTLKLRKARLGPDHPDTVASMNNLVAAYMDAGKPEKAVPLCEETLRFQLAIFGPNHPDTIASKHNLGAAYVTLGRLDEGMRLLEEVLQTRKVMSGADHPFTLMAVHRLVEAYTQAGRPEQALPLGEQAVQQATDKLGRDDFVTLRLMYALACAYQQAGKLEQALPLHEQTVDLAKAKLGPAHPQTLRSLERLAQAYAETGKLDRALPLFEEALKSERARLGPEHPDTLVTLANLAKCLLRQGDFTNAEARARECLGLRQRTTPRDWRTCAVQVTVGIALLGQKKLEDAEPLLLQGYAGLRERARQIPAGYRREVTEAAQALAQLYEAWGKPEEAARWRRELGLP